ncbi:MAG: radical SAM protein [Desulfurococcales archaeon]|nr:radical SAM protein [Desulfurococcales archaeon]
MVLVRASLGTLIVAGIEDGFLPREARPTTAYLLQYSSNGCMARCRFCIQSSSSSGRKLFLSRVSWPVVELDRFIEAVKDRDLFKRVCFQTVIKKGFVEETFRAVEKLSILDTPLSLAITPVDKSVLEEFKRIGVEHLGVGLDTASPRIFKAMDKPFTWSRYIGFIRDGVEVFGSRKVDVHLVIGLGETVEEVLNILKLIYSLGAEASLFAYTPFRGLSYYSKPPSLELYRFYQIVNHLLRIGVNPWRYILLEGDSPRFRKELIRDLGWRTLYEAVLTSGCPYCNRPYYNESPRGPFYNYPSHSFLEKYLRGEREFLRKLFI